MSDNLSIRAKGSRNEVPDIPDVISWQAAHRTASVVISDALLSVQSESRFNYAWDAWEGGIRFKAPPSRKVSAITLAMVFVCLPWSHDGSSL